MQHTQLISRFLGKTVQVWDNRLVRVTGYGPTGSFACEPVDGAEPLYHASTLYLQDAYFSEIEEQRVYPRFIPYNTGLGFFKP